MVTSSTLQIGANSTEEIDISNKKMNQSNSVCPREFRDLEDDREDFGERPEPLDVNKMKNSTGNSNKARTERKLQISSRLSSWEVNVAQLPPLREPRNDVKHNEFLRGVIFVNLLIVIFVSLTHGIALGLLDVFPKSAFEYRFFLIAIYSEATIAIVCLFCLGASDPGILKRSSETCFPIPSEMEPWLKSYVKESERNMKERRVKNQEDDHTEIPCLQNDNIKHDEGKDSIVEQNHEENKETEPNDICEELSDLSPPKQLYISHPDENNHDTYCVRCLIWRKHKPNVKYFHCAVCQRCVEHFDHHCSVFGRCIAGKVPFQGNYTYFMIIILMAAFGYWTTVICVVWAFSIKYGAKFAVPISMAILWYINTSLICHGARAAQSFQQYLCRRSDTAKRNSSESNARKQPVAS